MPLQRYKGIQRFSNCVSGIKVANLENAYIHAVGEDTDHGKECLRISRLPILKTHIIHAVGEDTDLGKGNIQSMWSVRTPTTARSGSGFQ